MGVGVGVGVGGGYFFEMEADLVSRGSTVTSFSTGREYGGLTPGAR